MKSTSIGIRLTSVSYFLRKVETLWRKIIVNHNVIFAPIPSAFDFEAKKTRYQHMSWSIFRDFASQSIKTKTDIDKYVQTRGTVSMTYKLDALNHRSWSVPRWYNEPQQTHKWVETFPLQGKSEVSLWNRVRQWIPWRHDHSQWRVFAFFCRLHVTRINGFMLV